MEFFQHCDGNAPVAVAARVRTVRAEEMLAGTMSVPLPHVAVIEPVLAFRSAQLAAYSLDERELDPRRLPAFLRCRIDGNCSVAFCRERRYTSRLPC